MKYLKFNAPRQGLTLPNWRLGSLVLAICLFLTLSSCRDFSPKDPQVSSHNPATPAIEEFDFTAQSWKRIEGEGVSLSLPESYRGGNPTRDLREIQSQLTQLQDSYGKRLQSVKQNLENTVLIAFDARSLSEDSLTNVNIVKQPIKAERLNLETYLSQAVKQLQKNHEIEQKGIITDNGVSQGRILASTTTDEGIAMKQLFYFQATTDPPTEPKNRWQKFFQILKQLLNLQSKHQTIWIATYTTPASEFNQRSANFEQSIASLQWQT